MTYRYVATAPVCFGKRDIRKLSTKTLTFRAAYRISLLPALCVAQYVDDQSCELVRVEPRQLLPPLSDKTQVSLGSIGDSSV